jgi:hypothetical protein
MTDRNEDNETRRELRCMLGLTLGMLGDLIAALERLAEYERSAGAMALASRYESEQERTERAGGFMEGYVKAKEMANALRETLEAPMVLKGDAVHQMHHQVMAAMDEQRERILKAEQEAAAALKQAKGA